MSRPKIIPTYRRHKQSGQAIVTLTDAAGSRKDVLLGRFGSKASKDEYARLIQLWQAEGSKFRADNGPGVGLTVAELILRFWEHVETYYRTPDGDQAHEQTEFQVALRPLNFLFGPTPAAEFGPKALQAVREVMVKGYDHPKHGPQASLSRGVINRRIGRIKRAFKWAVREELIPGTVLHALQAVDGLRHGRSEARETEPVKPVPQAFVEQTIAAAQPIIGDMIRLQLLTGIRPGELVIMRGVDLDMTGPSWEYRPAKHKTQHHGLSRVIAIGPQAQAIIRRYLKPKLDAYLFSPKEAMVARSVALRSKRKTRVQPSQQNRRKANRRRGPKDRYTTGTYRRAVERASERANVPHWHPHQLRHTRATEIRKRFGIDAARAVLGHRSPAITEVYAELDQGQAAEVMAKIG